MLGVSQVKLCLQLHTGVKTEHLKLAFKIIVTHSVLCELLLLCGLVIVFPWLLLFILVSAIVMLFWNKWGFLLNESEICILFSLMWLQEQKIVREAYVEYSILVLTTSFYSKMCLNQESLYSEDTALLCILWTPAHLQNQAATFPGALCYYFILGNLNKLPDRGWWGD